MAPAGHRGRGATPTGRLCYGRRCYNRLDSSFCGMHPLSNLQMSKAATHALLGRQYSEAAAREAVQVAAEAAAAGGAEQP